MGFGVLLSIVAAVCNGAFSVPSRFDVVREADVSPYLFSMIVCVGVGLSGIVTLAVLPQVFVWQGLLSGALYVGATTCSYLAIQLLSSVAVASGIWCGVAMAASFLFGVYTGNHFSNPPMAWASLLLMILGVVLLSRVQSTASRPETLVDSLVHTGGAGKASAGIAAAVAAGVQGGLVLAPMNYVSIPISGLLYVPSMSLGVLMAAPFVLGLQMLYPEGKLGRSQLVAASAWGLASGVTWNVGNACSILAIPMVGLAVAYPIMQSGLFVAGLLGMLLFNELPGRSTRMEYLGCGLLLMFGAVLLSLSR